MIIRENAICWKCSKENNWNAQAEEIARKIRQRDLDRIFDDPFDPITTEARIDNKLEEFWKQHKVPCLIVENESEIMLTICKKHIQAEVDQL